MRTSRPGFVFYWTANSRLDPDSGVPIANNQYSQADVDAHNAFNERSFRQIMSGQGSADHGQLQETIRQLREEGQRLAQENHVLSERNRYLEGELDRRQSELDHKQGELNQSQRLAQDNQQLSERNRYLEGELNTRQHLARENHQLSERNTYLEGELNTRQRQLDQKQGELDQKQRELDQKQGQLNQRQGDQGDQRVAQLSARNIYLEGELEAKRRELDHKARETRQLIEKNASFRDIILSDAQKQDVSDDQIVQAFAKVRQGALAVAKDRALNVDQAPALQPDTPENVRNFYVNSAWNSWRHNDRELHVREKIFEILFHFVLDTAAFGIRGSQAAPPDTLDLIARGLGAFEATAKDKQVSMEVLGKWRNATLDCVEALSSDRDQASQQVAAQLWNFIDPILNKQSLDQVQTLWSRVLNLCKDAFEFNVITRKSPDEYRCEVFPTLGQHQPGNIESWADAHAVDGGRASEAGEDMAYVLFGVLTKKSTYHRNELVLAKAEVVMKKQTL